MFTVRRHTAVNQLPAKIIDFLFKATKVVVLWLTWIWFGLMAFLAILIAIRAIGAIL